MKSSDPAIRRWWAQYMESTGNLQIRLLEIWLLETQVPKKRLFVCIYKHSKVWQGGGDNVESKD